MSTKVNKPHILIASDHAGFELKAHLTELLEKQGYQVSDHGTCSTESTDYPDYAHALATALLNEENAEGILICGSANGVNMTANKHQGVRSAIAWLPEIAQLAKQHNNANVVAIPARFVSESLAEEIVSAFLEADFEGGRHARRADKIDIAQ